MMIVNTSWLGRGGCYGNSSGGTTLYMVVPARHGRSAGGTTTVSTLGGQIGTISFPGSAYYFRIDNSSGQTVCYSVYWLN